jgi:hypothetical protein
MMACTCGWCDAPATGDISARWRSVMSRERRLWLGVHRRAGDVLPGLPGRRRAAYRALPEGEGEVMDRGWVYKGTPAGRHG